MVCYTEDLGGYMAYFKQSCEEGNLKGTLYNSCLVVMLSDTLKVMAVMTVTLFLVLNWVC